jgi:hypothetical protein
MGFSPEPELKRYARDPTDLGEAGAKIGQLENGVSGSEPSLPGAGVGPKAIPALPSGTQIGERVNPSSPDPIPGGRVDVNAESIQIGHVHQVHARSTREFDLPPRPRVDLEELVSSSRSVAFELSTEKAVVSDTQEKTADAIGRVCDLVQWDRHSVRAIPEAGWIHPDPSAGQQPDDTTVAVDEAFDTYMVPRRTGDPLLKEHLVPAGKRTLELLGGTLTVVQRERLLAELLGEPLRIARLQEERCQLIVVNLSEILR